MEDRSAASSAAATLETEVLMELIAGRSVRVTKRHGLRDVSNQSALNSRQIEEITIIPVVEGAFASTILIVLSDRDFTIRPERALIY